jgi:crotonobetainyl-CoA:carnitine CoA-transferase CaiB-like acyl-CoA transferase
MSDLALAGLRVVDVTTSLAGPYCTELLGALGADVIKIEQPDHGDDTRVWGPPFWDGEGVLFLAANANKRSVALRLSHSAAREALLRLVDQADICVVGLRPGLAEARGLDASSLCARNSRLVHVTIGAYGRGGPLAPLAGYDPLMQAETGLMSITGEPDRGGARVGTSLIDFTTGLWALIGILLALSERERTGHGAAIDVSLYETGLALVPYQLMGYLATGEIPTAQGSGFALVAPYQTFATSDGEIMIAAANDRHFALLCDAVGRPALASDPRFASNPERVRHRAELAAILGEMLGAQGSKHWLERLRAVGVPTAPVQTIADVANAEQTHALEMLQRLSHQSIPDFAEIAAPLTISGRRVLHRTPPPRLGADTRAVLRELGYSDREIGELERAGAIRAPPAPAD